MEVKALYEGHKAGAEYGSLEATACRDGRAPVEYVWVKGHNGHPYNERCDALAVEAAQTAMDTNADVPTHVVSAN